MLPVSRSSSKENANSFSFSRLFLTLPFAVGFLSLQNTAIAQCPPPTGSGTHTITFSANCTFNVPATVTSMTIEAWGGGGGGGGARANCSGSCQQTAAGGGGKGGMYSITVVPVTPGQSCQVIIGTGGSAGAGNSTSASAGTAGGESRVLINGTKVAWALGGNGGNGANGSGAAAGASTYAAGSLGETTGSGTIYHGGNGAPGARTTTRQSGGGGGGGAGTGNNGASATNPTTGGGTPSGVSAGGAGGANLGGNGGNGGSGTGTGTTAGNGGSPRGGAGGGARAHRNGSSAVGASGGAGAGGFVTISWTSELPIELLSFSGEYADNQITLNWITATEQNNAYFEIERSYDGSEWEFVGRQEGANNSSSTRQYSLTDNKVTIVGTTAYYRLTQYDFDGTHKTFGPIAVNFGAAKENAFILFPNPANDRVQLKLKDGTEWLDNAQVRLYDITGKQLSAQQLSGQIMFDISAQPPGIYLVELEYNNQVHRSRLIKK